MKEKESLNSGRISGRTRRGAAGGKDSKTKKSRCGNWGGGLACEGNGWGVGGEMERYTELEKWNLNWRCKNIRWIPLGIYKNWKE